MKTWKNVSLKICVAVALVGLPACGSSGASGGDDPLNIPAPVSHLSISSPNSAGDIRFTTKDGFADAGTTVTVTTTTATSSLSLTTDGDPLYATASATADANGRCQIELEGTIGDTVTIEYTLDGVASETTSTVPDDVSPLPLTPTLLDVSIDPTLDLAMVLAGDGSDGTIYVGQLSDGTITQVVDLPGADGIAKIATDPRTGAFYAIDTVNDVLWEIDANSFAAEAVAVSNLADIAAGQSGNFEILSHSTGAFGSSYYNPRTNTQTTVLITVASGAAHVQSPLVATDITAGGIDVYGLVSEMADGKFYLARYQVPDVTTITQSPANAVELTGVSNPGGLFVFSDGAEALVTDGDDDTVYRVNLTTGTITAITVGDDPRGVVVDNEGVFAYVANSGDDTVMAIRLSDNTVVSEERSGLTPTEVATDTIMVVVNTGDQTAALFE